VTDDVRNIDDTRGNVENVETDETDSTEREVATEFEDIEVEDAEFQETGSETGLETGTDDSEPPQPGRRGLHLPRIPVPGFLRNSKVVTGILVALVLISGSVASWVYFKQYRPDQQTDAGVRSTVVRAATDGTTALLSYTPDTLDQDFANAKSHLAGDFLSYYTQFTQQVVAPAAKERQLKTSAHVKGSAVAELHPDSAVVLVFVDQTTTSKDNQQPTLAVSTVILEMNRINGNWMITKFTPVS
jgi:Mce-associated membrane protein